jgi:predicted HTH domain antitoxin
MCFQLKQEFEEILEPFGNKAASFFLAASLYHAHKISFTAAAALADLTFEAFLTRLQEHFSTGFFLSDETVLEDIDSVAKIMDRR